MCQGFVIGPVANGKESQEHKRIIFFNGYLKLSSVYQEIFQISLKIYLYVG